MKTSLLSSIRSTGIILPGAGMTILNQWRKKWLESMKNLSELKLWSHLCGICGASLDHQIQPVHPHKPKPNLDPMSELTSEFTEDIDPVLLPPMILLATQRRHHHQPLILTICLGTLPLSDPLCHSSEPSSFLSPTAP